MQTVCEYTSDVQVESSSGRVAYSIDGRVAKRIRLVKYITYQSSSRPQARELCRRSERVLDRAVQHGPDELLESQRAFLDAFWSRSDVVIDGHAEWQQTIRFNLFHI